MLHEGFDDDDGNTVSIEDVEEEWELENDAAPGGTKDGAVCDDNALKLVLVVELDLELDLEVVDDFRELFTDSGCL